MQEAQVKRIILGYFAAISCAATIVVLPTALDMVSYSSGDPILIPLFIFLAALPYALLLSPLFIIAAHRNSVRHPAYYIFSSTAAGYIISFLVGEPAGRFQIWVVAAGTASGFVFWLIAGRHVGRSHHAPNVS